MRELVENLVSAHTTKPFLLFALDFLHKSAAWSSKEELHFFKILLINETDDPWSCKIQYLFEKHVW